MSTHPLRRRRQPSAPCASHEHGAVAVEFALVFPILVMLVFGIIAFGIVLSQQVTLGNAVRDGARFGTVGLFSAGPTPPNQTCRDVIALTRSNANSLAMKGESAVTVVVTRGASPDTATPRCTANAGTASTVATGTGATERPCKGAAATDNLYVKASFNTQAQIPLIPMPSFTIDSQGAYRCEYDD